MKYNFNGFTTKANEALNSAISLAESLGHTYVGSEHLLLGLLRVGSGVAASVLISNGITAENIEVLLKETIGYGTPTKLSPDHFTPRAKRVLETALGAQAATLTAMRSAYDTACEYSAKLETEMNRKRQSQVTADVIESSSEFAKRGDI